MRVLAMHSHPDDIEFVMAGTLFLLARQGHEVHYMNIADGSCGTAEHSREQIRQTRRSESIAAAGVLSAEYHESITSDLEVFYSDELIRKVAAVIRDVVPDVMLVASPQDYMEDHMNACRLSVTGAFVRAMINYETIPARPPIDHDVVLYHAMPHALTDGLRRPIYPEFYVDVTAVMEEKSRMLACHRSQKDWLDLTQGMDSYIGSMRQLSAQVGKLSGRFEYAEGWRRHLHVGYARRELTPLEEILSDHIETGVVRG